MKIKIVLGLGMALALALALGVGGWFVYTAYAQNADPNTTFASGGCHNSQAVFDLLQTNAADLKAQRQAGKSLLDIATAKGVTEQALTDALLQPMDSMHSWMGKNVQGFDDEQMDQAMESQIAKDLRETKYGTMTDYRLFSTPGSMMGRGGMMGGYNGSYPGGMMNGWNGSNPGAAPNRGNGAGSGGMMNGAGGMMGGRTY